MAKQNPNEVNQKLSNLLAGGINQEQLDGWKTKYGTVHIVTVKVDHNNTLTGYFRKPGRDIMANCVNLSGEGKVFEAKEFLATNTYLGGDGAILTNEDAAISAQANLWKSLNFLQAEVVKY